MCASTINFTSMPHRGNHETMTICVYNNNNATVADAKSGIAYF